MFDQKLRKSEVAYTKDSLSESSSQNQEQANGEIYDGPEEEKSSHQDVELLDKSSKTESPQ